MRQIDGAWIARVSARAGLLGNPSDGYGGRVIATTIDALQATVELRDAERWHCVGGSVGHDEGASHDRSAVEFDEPGDVEALLPALSKQADGAELLAAAVRMAGRLRPELVERPGELSFATTIPRQVGLSGSSAIVIAALQVLADRIGATWAPVHLAKAALEVETELLGWAAGPQDRVVQAMGGVVDMDFATPWQADAYQVLDAALLPPLFVAWDCNVGTASDVAHSDVRERWARGDHQIIAAMKEFAELAGLGRDAFDAGSAASRWPGLFDRAFDLRASFWHIRDRDRALVATGRAQGAGVAFAGSGGAVVGAVQDPTRLAVLAQNYREIDAGFLVLGQRQP